MHFLRRKLSKKEQAKLLKRRPDIKRALAKRKKEKSKTASKKVGKKLFSKMNAKDPETRVKAKEIYKKLEASPSPDAKAVVQNVKAEAASEQADRVYEEEYEEEESIDEEE